MRITLILITLLAAMITPCNAATISGTTAVEGKGACKEVVVYLEGGAKPAAGHAVIDQRHKMFSPHISVITVGTTVSFPNDDTVFHNVFAYFQAKRFDLGMYPQGSTKRVKFDKPGVVDVFCNVHSSMSAHIMVVDTPYYTISGSDGRFEITGVPAGTYHIKAWQESGATADQAITVGESGDKADLSLTRK